MATYAAVTYGTAAAAGAGVNTGTATVTATDTVTTGTAAAAAVIPPGPTTAPLVPVDLTVANNIYRSSYSISYTVAATLAGQPVAGAQTLTPVGGSITDTIRPGVRRQLTLELAAEPGLYDLLAPIGTVLTVTAHVTAADRVNHNVPMGVFSIDSESLSVDGGKLTITAPDRWALIQRAKFIGPAASVPGIKVVDQIRNLITSALGGQEPVVVTATSTAVVGAMTWPVDRAQTIIDLATSIGAWVYTDRDGVFTVADIPLIGDAARWLVDAVPNRGVLITLTRSKSRTSTANVVLVESTASAGESFPTQFLFDADPKSPTYAGRNPVTDPGSAGPFGIVVYPYSTSLPLTIPQAQALGQAILAKTVGLASQVSLTQVPNPNVDAFDVIDVMPPRERYDLPRIVERHVVDTVTHPLDVTQPQQIAGRSTRSDPYT